ncbi:MAG: site-specific DNA-methyltransferase [Acidobacteriota bacterium]|nr:site-specific DNA-methyltransferase [Acidobacteriota bacterium]
MLCPEDGLVVDPFGGSGTTGLAALPLRRRSVLIDNSEQYYREAVRRLCEEGGAEDTATILQRDLYG